MRSIHHTTVLACGLLAALAPPVLPAIAASPLASSTASLQTATRGPRVKAIGDTLQRTDADDLVSATPCLRDSTLEASLLALEDRRETDLRLPLSLLGDPDPAVRARAALTLGRIGHPWLVGPIAMAMRAEPDATVRGRECFALGLIGRPGAINTLAQVLAGDVALSVRARAAQALGLIGNPLALEPLLAALPPPGLVPDPAQTAFVGHVAVALARLSDRRATERLAGLLTAGGPARVDVLGVRRAAAWALARMGDPAAGPVLTWALDDRDALIRTFAARGIARCKFEGARTRLEVLLDDPVPGVRVAAIRALGEIARPAQDPSGTRGGDVRAPDTGTASDARIAHSAAALARVALGTGSEPFRVEAIVALGRQGDRAWRDPLVALASAPTAIGRAARVAAARLGLGIEAVERLGASDRSVLGGLALVQALAASSDAGARTRLEGLALRAMPLDQTAMASEDRHAGTGTGTKAGGMTCGAARGPCIGSPRCSRVRAVDQVGASPYHPTEDSSSLARIDPRSVIRAAAVQALADASSPPPVQFWHLLLVDPDAIIRGAAVEGLLKAGGASQIPAALRAYTQWHSEVTDDFKSSLVDALAQVGPAARSALETLLGDHSRNVRIAAVKALEQVRRDQMGNGDWRAAATTPAELAQAYAPLDVHCDASFYRDALTARTRHPVATVITSRGTFVVGLLPDLAPLTVASFVRLARAGFFDGQIIARVVPDFVVQMGDPRTDLNGGPGYTLRCEVSEAPYVRGTVGMALAGKDTGGSQFFVTHSPQPHLEGIYTVFGRVIRGMDVLDAVVVGDTIERVTVAEKSSGR